MMPFSFIFKRSILILLLVFTGSVSSEPLKRHILTFYDAKTVPEATISDVHQFAEMPLNHLGLVVRYHDINESLPNDEAMSDMRGILLWLNKDAIPDRNQLTQWLIAQHRKGKRLVVMSASAFAADNENDDLTPALSEEFWDVLGLRPKGQYKNKNFEDQFIFDPFGIVGFEKKLPKLMPGYLGLARTSPDTLSHLSINNAREINQLITTNRNGGYAADGYAYFANYDTDVRHWYINPFEFFRLAFATDDLPKPDTTTLNGRRIYYSHIDGDGWRNLTLVPKYRLQRMYSSEVLLKEIFQGYPELPVSIGPVTADLDEKALGTENAQRIALEIFKLPNIEAASHTHSHPLQWGFFAKPVPGLEAAYRHLYPKRKADKPTSILSIFGKPEKSEPPPPDSKQAVRTYDKLASQGSEKAIKLKDYYSRPRAYFTGPYSTDKEIQGSFDIISKYLPNGKRVEVLLWSGDTQPYEEAVRATRLAGTRNLNGGDTRFDRRYNSYAWVTPTGRIVGNERQIYSSNSNENTYTNLWTGPFYGFRHLVQTFERTESPIRVKPMNLYYHMYSGERLGALNALHEIIDYVKKQDYTPITASHFAAIGDGFFTTELAKIGNNQWHVSNRDALNTIRFDNATFKTLDLSRSRGVLGMRHHQGSLYIHLDQDAKEATFALTDLNSSTEQAHAEKPYLIDSHWPISKLRTQPSSLNFSVKGFGPGQMTWWVPNNGTYELSLSGEKTKLLAKENILKVHLNTSPYEATQISLRYLGEG